MNENKPIIRPRNGQCDSGCPQRRPGVLRKGLGRCGILGYEVRAEPDAGFYGVEPPPSDSCPVLAIRGAVVEESPPNDWRCGVCGSVDTRDDEIDDTTRRYECAHCTATMTQKWSNYVGAWACWKSWKKPVPPPSDWAVEALRRIAAQTHEDSRLGRRCATCIATETLADHGATAVKP